MANQPNPRKFSEKIALLNQKQAEETRAFEAIMREVSDVTSRVTGVASSGNSLVASPIESGSGDGEGSVKSAGASPPQTSGKHLRINLGNQFKAGGSLPNVNNNNDHTRSVPGMTVEPATVGTISSTVRCANSVTVTNHNNHHRRRHRHTNTTDCRRRETETTFPASIYSVDPKTTTNNVEELQNNMSMYRTGDRGRSVPGPMRSRPTEKRHEMPRYSGVPYLSPPPPDTWRRTNSDSALHQSANESCQMLSSIPHRRDPHASAGMVGSEHRDLHRSFMERPRSSCEMPRVPDISIYPSSQPPGQQIPIGNNTGSLPDLSNVHFPSPLPAPLDQEEHSSSTQYSNSPQTSSPTTLSPTSLQQAGRLSFSQEPSSAHVQNHLSVPVNSRFLHTCKGVTLENSTSTSQQDLHSYSQPPPPSHSPQHFIYHQPSSPLPPQSPNPSHSHQTATSLASYRTPQPVNRPSPQSSPSLTVRGSPLSYSNNPSAPPSPTGHLAQPNFTPSNIDQNNHIPDQTQAATLQQHFEQFSMDWAQLVQQLVESGCTWTSQPQPEMDSPVAPTTLSTYISSPSHTANYTQSEMINVGGESGSGDAGYFSTSPQLAYQPRTPTSTQQLTPQTPNTPSIILTDFSGNLGLSSSEFMKDFHNTEMPSDLSDDLFPADDDFRQSLGPMDFASLQMLSDPDLPITDEAVEDHFRLSNF